jgi:hypothetical protein
MHTLHTSGMVGADNPTQTADGENPIGDMGGFPSSTILLQNVVYIKDHLIGLNLSFLVAGIAIAIAGKSAGLFAGLLRQHEDRAGVPGEIARNAKRRL